MRGYKKLVSSGLVNIGCIPESWYVAKINYFSKLQTGGTPNKDIVEYWENGNINWMSSGEVNNEFVYETKNKITELGMKNSNASILPINSVMMALNGQGKTKGTVAVLKVETTCNQSLAAFIADEKHLHYLYLYYFLKYNYKFIRGLVGDGLRDGISMGLLKSLKVCLPTYDEQRKIGEFLYKKEQAIKNLIVQKESMIRLLGQQRQSIITEAVTKGLNPNAKMKDSGVEWIGEIPEHWGKSKLKYLTKQIIDGTHHTPDYQAEGVPFLRVTDITQSKGKDINLSNVKYISQKEHRELINRCRPEYGDLLVSKNGTIGIPKVIDWDWEFSIFVSLCLIKMNSEKLNPYFASFYFESQLVDEQIAFGSKKSTIMNLHLDKVKEFFIFVPPLFEQIEIVQFLKDKVSEVDNLKGILENQIENLKEYRQSLIYEAVTGKIHVHDMELD